MNKLSLDILLIDGHPDHAQWALQAFQNHPHPLSVTHFSNGQDSLFFLRSAEPLPMAPSPKLILFDWDLPHGNGPEVLAELKSDDILSKIPVVIWTSSARQEDVLNAYQHFANSYVVKPRLADDFGPILSQIASFWLTTAQLPEP